VPDQKLVEIHTLATSAYLDDAEELQGEGQAFKVDSLAVLLGVMSQNGSAVRKSSAILEDIRRIE